MAHFRSQRPEITAVYGGGAEFAMAFGMGVAETLIEEGVPLRKAPALGTSGGAWVASLIARSITREEIPLLPELELPDMTPGLLQEAAEKVFGRDTYAPTVAATAIRMPGRHLRILSAAKYPVAEVVAASSAIPDQLAPVYIGGEKYVDGGFSVIPSGTQAHLARRAERMLVVAPLAGNVFGLLGQLAEMGVRSEIAIWQRRHRGYPTLIMPNRSIANLVKKPDDLFNHEIANETYEQAKAQTREMMRTRRSLWSLIKRQR